MEVLPVDDFSDVYDELNNTMPTVPKEDYDKLKKEYEKRFLNSYTVKKETEPTKEEEKEITFKEIDIFDGMTE